MMSLDQGRPEEDGDQTVTEITSQKRGRHRRSPDGKYATGRARRELILQAATELFRRKGYHTTSMDAIGQAVGVTGPAVYRHFENKQALLAAIFKRALRVHQDIIDSVIELDVTPVEALEEIVRRSTREIVEHPNETLMFLQRSAELAAADRREIAWQRRRLITGWVELLTEVRPELSTERAAVVAQAAGGLLNGSAFIKSKLEGEAVSDLLAEMTLAALLGRGNSDTSGSQLRSESTRRRWA